MGGYQSRRTVIDIMLWRLEVIRYFDCYKTVGFRLISLSNPAEASRSRTLIESSHLSKVLFLVLESKFEHADGRIRAMQVGVSVILSLRNQDQALLAFAQPRSFLSLSSCWQPERLRRSSLATDPAT